MQAQQVRSGSVSKMQGIQDNSCHMHMECVKGFGPVTKGRMVAWKVLYGTR